MSDLQRAQQALDKAKIQLMRTKDSVFFTTVCFSLKHRFDTTIPTADTDGLTVRYNPAFFLSLNAEEQVFLLLHETLHVAFSHMLRQGSREAKKWNHAADYLINYILIKRGFKMPAGGLYDAQLTDAYSTDQIYDLLPDPPAGGGGPGAGGFAPNDLLPPGSGAAAPGQDPITAEVLQEKIDDILVRASVQSRMAGDKPGAIPGQLQFHIDSLLTPRLPWNRLLKAFMTKVVKRGYTWRRPNRRFFPDHYLPSRSSAALCDIAVAIDTSASVTDEEFQQFASEVHTILQQQRPSSLTLVQFDTRIHQVSAIRSPRDLLSTTFHGRGGTDVAPVMAWAAEHRPHVLLVFSDGEFPRNYINPKVPVVWLVNNNKAFTAPWGKTIHYDI